MKFSLHLFQISSVEMQYYLREGERFLKTREFAGLLAHGNLFGAEWTEPKISD